MRPETIADLMTTEIVTLSPRQHITRAMEAVRTGRIRHLPVVNKKNELLGLVTQRDLLAASQSQNRPVSAIMNRDIKTVRPSTPAYEAAYLLLRHDIGCVPVTDDHGVLLGIVTDTDFVRVAYLCLGGAVPVEQLEAEERGADLV